MNVVSRHNSLLVQHDIIDKLMKKYNTAATGVIETKLSTTQHFYWYRIWAVIFVSCLYTRRGGIDINPTRATDTSTLYKYGGGIADVVNFCTKTARQ